LPFVPPNKLISIGQQLDFLEIALLETGIELANFPSDRELISNLETKYETMREILANVRNQTNYEDSEAFQKAINSIQEDLESLKQRLSTIIHGGKPF
jgi:molecular chaperone GrpE (heat shock protein)